METPVNVKDVLPIEDCIVKMLAGKLVCRAVPLVVTPEVVLETPEVNYSRLYALAGRVTCIVVMLAALMQERPACGVDTLLSTPYSVLDDCSFAMIIVT